MVFDEMQEKIVKFEVERVKYGNKIDGMVNYAAPKELGFSSFASQFVENDPYCEQWHGPNK